MDNLEFEFSATSGVLRGKTTTDVKVFKDRMIIHRDTKRANIPKEMIISFSDISSITYDENNANAWISFAVATTLPNSQLKSAQPVYAMRPGEIVITPNAKVAPFDEPYAIIFPKTQKAEARAYYEKLMKLRQDAQRHSKEVYTVGQESALEQLKKLKELYDLSIINDAEYNEKREKLLQKIR